MKERKRYRTLSRTVYSIQKRFLAFLLAAAMILTNVGADINTVFAASSSEPVIFSMSGSQLIKAIDEAIANGEEVTAEDLDFTNGKIAEFEKLFFGEGKIYEAYPEPEGGSMDAELRVFVRLPEDADNMYMVTGDEEIIFLYVNNGENTISCTTEITRMDNGVEKVKKTPRITVKSYEAAYGDEEVNVITKPIETTAPAATESQAETKASEETSAAPEETQVGLPEETAAALEESQAKAPAEEKTQEAAQPEETAAPAEEASEVEITEPVASIIRHQAPVVAANENGDAAETAEEPKETQALIEEKATEAADLAETTQAPAEETTADSKVTIPDTEETAAAPAEGETAYEDGSKAEAAAETAPDVASPSESKPVTEIPEPEDKVSAAGTGDLVGIGYCSTAKAYVTTINQLKAFEDYDGYKISYTINPEASARIVEGARGVEEGQALTFGVKNQIGYAVESVTANGESLIADSITDNEDATQTVWYSVPEIYEDQEVEVYMTETGEHPAFADSVTINGVTITATASEGVIPAGTKLDAKEVSTEIGSALKDKVEAEDGGQVTSVLAYDINLMLNGTKLDNSWSDNGYVTVTFSGSRIETETAEGSSVEIYAVNDTNTEELNADTAASATADTLTLESVGETVDVSGDSGVSNLSFEAEHFTIYAITIIGGKEKPAVATYNFYNGSALVSKQLVKNNEYLIEPENPQAIDGKKFVGWVPDGSDEAFDFTMPVAVSENTTVNLYATYEQVRYVFFMDDVGRVIATKGGKTGEAISTTDVTFVTGTTSAVTGWSLQEFSPQTPVGDSVMLENADIVLYPIVSTANWVTYDSGDDATYYAPRYVMPGEKAVNPGTPTRAGYKFKYWSLSANGSAYNFNSVVSNNITLYAVWDAQTVNYSVVYWFEKPNIVGDAGTNVSNYMFNKSETRSALVGSSVSASSLSSKGTISYGGFSHGNENLVIKGDGTTVLNLYYKRTVYTFRFNLDGGTMNFNGATYNTSNVYSFTAKYEQNIQNLWPSSKNATFSKRSGWYTLGFLNWKFSNNSTGLVTHRLTLTKDLIDVGNGATTITYTAYWGDTRNVQVNYWFEQISAGVPSGETRTFTNNRVTKTYVKNNLYSQSLVLDQDSTLDPKAIQGVRNVGRDDESSWGTTTVYNFFYDREIYSLGFDSMGGSTVASVTGIMYETPMGNYEPEDPFKANSVFSGWYLDSACSLPFTFDTETMPNSDTKLFAKWNPITYTVTAHLTNDGSGGSETITNVSYGAVISEADLPSEAELHIPAGNEFRGWGTKDASGKITPYNFSTKVTQNIVLYPIWSNISGYTVTYDVGESAMGTAPTDNWRYEFNAAAKVKSAESLSYEGKVFVGWKSSYADDTAIYYPGDKITITSDVVLTAQWEDVIGTISLTYYSNDGTGQTSIVPDLVNNQSVTVAENMFAIPEGKYFDGWNTLANGTGETFEPGSKALVDKANNNELYAQWKDLIEVEVTAENVTKIYDGTSYGISPVSVPAGATITYKDAQGNYTLTTSPTRKDVGTTTVEFKASMYGYADAYGSADVTIEARPVIITAAASGKVYGEADPAFAKAKISTYIGTELAGIDLSVTRSDAGINTLGTHKGVLSIGKTAAQLNAAYTNYSFTVVPADFTITTNENGLSVSADDVSKVYDGTSYGVSPASNLTGATITYKDADGNYTLTTSPTRKDVGTTKVEFKVSLYGYADAYGSADVTISKKGVTITAAESSKVYGDADPVFANAKINTYIGTELAGINLSVTRSDAGINTLGTHKGVLSIGKTAAELNAAYTNYSFTVVPADFTITTNENGLSVSAGDVSKVYDGNGYGVSPASNLTGATIIYKDAQGNYTLTTSPTRKDVGTTTVEFKASLYGYADAYGSADVTISKKGVTITTAESGKVYGDADPTFADAKISTYIGTELDGIDLSVTRSDAGINTLGTHKGVLRIGKTAAELNAAYTNYSFTVVPADFTITTNENGLSVSADDVSKVYDGTGYGVNPACNLTGVTITYKDAQGNYTLTTSPTRKDVGTTTVEFKASLYGYADAYGSADVTISKKGVTITAAEGSKVYGDADPAFANAKISTYIGTELAGIDLSVTRSNAGINTIGIHRGVLSIGKTAAELNTEYPNYSFTVIPADFTITTNENGLSVSADDVSKVYDGTGYGVIPTGNLTGVTITYRDAQGNYTLTTSPTRKDVGTTKVEFKASLYGYADAYGSADVTIEARPVTITVAASGKVYGEADPAFADAKISTYIGTELAGIDLSVTRSDVGINTLGIHKGVLRIGKTEAELNAAYTNYSFTVESADFTITTNESGLSVSAYDVSKVYDGTGYGVIPTGNLTGAAITYKDADGNYTLTTSPTRKDVGTTKVEFKASLYGYADAYGSADVTIEARPITITAAESGKVYGEADPAFADAKISTYIGTELDGINLRVIRSNAGTNTLGTHKGVLSIGKTAAELNAAYTNYSFTIIPADFTITINEDGLSVSADNVSKVYDGTGYGVIPTGNLTGAAITYKDADGNYTLTTSPTRKDVGTTTVEFKASLYGYADVYGSADVTISKKGVTITATESSKVYGEADPTFADAKISTYIGTELDGINLSVIRSDAGTNTLGTHKGVLSIGKTASELNAAYTNYSFTIVPADFTITTNEDGLSVSADDVSKVYDGTGYGVIPTGNLTVATITYKDADGNYTLTTSPTRKDAGTTTVEFKASLYGYADAYGSADVIISKKDVTITVNSASKNYGQQDAALTFTGMIGDGDLIDKDDLGIVTYGRMPGDIGKENAGDDITLTAFYESNENYTVTIIPGKLTIVASDENAVVITGRQVTYDGSAYGLTDAHAVREGSTLHYSTDNVTFTEEAPTFTEAGVYVIYVKATNPNYSETAVVEGKVIINKRNITFTAGSASKTYDGNPLTNNSTTITSGTIADGQTWTVKVTGSQTVVGTSKNVASGAVISDGERDVTANYNISYISGDLTVTSSGGSSGGGGGGSSSGGGPSSSRPYTNGGPGDATVTIDPGQIPLASLPEDNSATNLVLIDDGNIPLAGLPKTGDKTPVQGVAAIVSGLLLAAYMAISRRRRDER